MANAPDLGFDEVLQKIVKKRDQARSGNMFVGYRRHAPNEFVAVFKCPTSGVEYMVDQPNCKQIEARAEPRSEAYIAAQTALSSWPKS